MVDEVKSTDDLLAAITDNDVQANSFQDIRNIIYSLAGVGAGETDDPASGTEPKGVEKLGNRRFRILSDGLWLCLAQGNGDIDIQANVRAAIAKNDDQQSPNYILNQTFIPGENNSVFLFDVHDCVVNDELSLEFSPTGGANVTVGSYFFTTIRVG